MFTSWTFSNQHDTSHARCRGCWFWVLVLVLVCGARTFISLGSLSSTKIPGAHPPSPLQLNFNPCNSSSGSTSIWLNFSSPPSSRFNYSARSSAANWEHIGSLQGKTFQHWEALICKDFGFLRSESVLGGVGECMFLSLQITWIVVCRRRTFTCLLQLHSWWISP